MSNLPVKISVLALAILAFIFSLMPGGEKASGPEPEISASPDYLSAEPDESPTPNSGSVNIYTVSRVIDGDTIELEDGRKVRYIGIDAPEMGDTKSAVGCFAVQSLNRNKELVLNKKVTLKSDKTDKDRYGRLLRYVYIDGIFVNLELVKEGYAESYAYPPDTSHQKELDSAEAGAKSAGQGLWAGCKIGASVTPIPYVNIAPSPSPSPSITITPTPTPSATPTPTGTAAPEPTPEYTPAPVEQYSLPACAQTDCDCGDFSSRAHAQWFYDNYDTSNKHRLDGTDKDGLVCETMK